MLPLSKGVLRWLRFLRNRFSKYTHYHLKKTVRMVTHNMIALELDVTWATNDTGSKHTRSRGFELLTFNREGFVTRMEIISNGWPEGLV